MPSEILKISKVSSKNEFAKLFIRAQNHNRGFTGTVLSLVPEHEVMIIKAPVDRYGVVNWKKISGLPYSKAREQKLHIHTHRSTYKGKPVLLVGLKTIK